MKRNIEISVISDVHLGTYGCHADELYSYLKSINPTYLIINGDFIDGWNFSKKYFPLSHIKVLQQILKMIRDGTKVVYITGNHDEMLRKYSRFELENFILDDKFILTIDEKTYWFFHGDVFDFSLSQSYGKWVAKIGGVAYDFLIFYNKLLNEILEKFGYNKFSLSKRVKTSVKQAVNFIYDFENTVIKAGIENKYDYVVCGHIHEPKISNEVRKEGSIIYMNSGDWVENLTALEYNNKEWSIYTYFKKK